MKQGNIYVLKDPISLEIRYVGQTSRKLKSRLSAHLLDAKKNKNYHNVNWIKSLIKDNLVPIIESIEECALDKLNEREIYWIAFYKNLGYNLTNSTDGGLGHRGFKQSKETKLKRSLIQKELANKGFYSLERNLKISNAKKGKSLSQEIKDKISNKLKGTKLSELTKEKLRGKKVIATCLKTGEEVEYLCISDAAKLTGLWKGNISNAINGRLKTYASRKWRFK